MFDWLVIGAGLGGMCGIARLLALSLKYPERTIRIIWVDKDNFHAGDLFKRYSTVSSNTPIKNFIRFFERIERTGVYPFSKRVNHFDCNGCELDRPCMLGIFCTQLQDMTDYWKKTFDNIMFMEGTVEHIERRIETSTWDFNIKHENNPPHRFHVSKIIIACGCEPKLPIRIGCTRVEELLNKTNSPILIPIQDALDINRLSHWDSYLSQTKIKHVVVFGNAHSGILVLKNLLELGWDTNRNIYSVAKKPIVFPLKIDGSDMELYDKSGIRGVALEWAQQNLQPVNRTSIQILSVCDQLDDVESILNNSETALIFATGFRPRYIKITNSQMRTMTVTNDKSKLRSCYGDDHHKFDIETGRIDDGIYGLGLAYPETALNHGVFECNVGIGEFMDYAEKIINM